MLLGGRIMPIWTSTASIRCSEMKRILLCMLALCPLVGTGCGGQEATAPQGEGPVTFPFTHYASGGTPEDYTATILFEESNSTFTAYQVAFHSCTCRDAQSNFVTVAYVELLNTRKSGEDAAIRTITFGNNQGLWGDSNPNYYRSEYTQEYMDQHFVQQLVKLTKRDVDAWQGYGTQVETVDPEAVAGATVSTSNITSMLKGLFAYHAEKYYGE